MNPFLEKPQWQDAEVQARLDRHMQSFGGQSPEAKTCAELLGLLDLTTLEGSDNQQKIEALCAKALSFSEMGLGLPHVAAVCVYPTLVGLARKRLESSDIRVAAVAGAFPSGLSPLNLRVEEVKYAVEEGAQEIDMVISRGRYLEGDFAYVLEEVAAIREACGEAHLKVILETGELKTAARIRHACELALQAGAHFLKTSTGKVQPAATPQAMLIMLEAIREHHQKTGNKVGIKPAGGISDAATALVYRHLVKQVLGGEWLGAGYFRIGASRLADALVEAVRDN